MAGSQNHRGSNQQRSYTSFDQFIAQNDFSQFNHNNNPYSPPAAGPAVPSSYYPSPSHNQQYYYQPTMSGGNSNYTLTADATEFVPQQQFNGYATQPQYGEYNGSHSGPKGAQEPPSVANQSVKANKRSNNNPPTESSSSTTPASTSSSSAATSGTGAIPKQQQRNRQSNQEKPSNSNNNRRQQNQQQQKNPKPGRRKYDPEERNEDYYSQWNGGGGGGRENGHDHHQQLQNGSYQNNTARHHNQKSSSTSATDREPRGHSNRSHRNEASSSSAAATTFRNNGNHNNNHRGGGGNAVDKKQQVGGGESKRKPTDYQPNRNLKRPEREIEMPVDISQREKQIVEIDAGHLECLVCCEQIKPFQSTWNCKNCYSILHLNCTSKWATRSKSDEGWRCPACQNLTPQVPHEYFCFCGKQKNPQYNRNDVAHSCGEVCHRKTNCEHPCTLLCHPGACPTCQASVSRNCGCGATTKTMICNQEEAITCDGLCDKLRNCGLHRCGQKCHTGACPECDEALEHECHCGRTQKEVPCTAENLEEMKFACENACEKELNCKNHKCQRQCHADECHDCELTPDRIRSCPCGKKPILASERKTCLDEIPLCEAVCNKILSCGVPSNPHRCISSCHLGPCPPCQKSTAVKCRCGQMDQMVKCKQLTTRADDARCKKKCTKKRSCGKHKCNLECCIDIDHICPLPCPSTLSCGKHKCERTCHPGHCLPCQRASFHELQCECGAQVLYPPVPCGTKKPVCDKPCTRTHVCTHAVLHNCHTGPVCDPCMIQTAKWCFGNHEQRRTIPCSQESFGCGMPCNKELACKEHKCIKKCHEGDCMSAGETCKQSCIKPRAICGHKCMAACHVGDCPDTMCKETVEVVCTCGNRKQNRLCNDFANEFKRIATAQLASSLQVGHTLLIIRTCSCLLFNINRIHQFQDMQSGGSSGLKDIFAPIKWTTAKKIECDDSCAILERNRRMAIGLQIRNPDLGSKLHTKYSDYLIKWMKEDPRFIEMIHDKLTELVKLAKESKQRSRSHSFPVMNREKRHAVHDMCEVFGVESVAYDAEPQRNIVATAHKDRAWLPAQSIMDVVKREGAGGMRRVPGPAWGVKRT